MGPSLSALAHGRPPAPRSLPAGCSRVCSMVRYRFFLYAGLLPYLLGAAWAYAIAGTFDATAVLERPRRRRARGGRRRGVQRILRLAHGHRPRLQSRPSCRRCPMAVLWLGVAAFAGALAVGVYLTLRGGWPILAFALLGGVAAIFYEAPPIRWAYRGLGELVIALSYGPWMVLGSLYLHTRALSWAALVASLVPGFLIMALAVVNAIPDFHQDRLVGKRNLVVRARPPPRRLALSRARGGRACWWCAVGVARACFPPGRASPRCSALPLLVASGACARAHLRDAARVRPRGAQHRVLLLVARAALHRRRPAGRLVPMNRIDRLQAPLFVSWQLTRDCDLCCLHCCTESAPGKRLPDELDAREAMRVADEIVAQRRALRDAVRRRAAGRAALLRRRRSASAAPASQLKIETNGQRFDARDRRAARPPADPLDPDQPRRRHAGGLRAPAARGRRSPRRMPRAARCAMPACRSRSRSRRRGSTFTRPAPVIERARALGAFRFNTGRLMRIGTAARLWDKLEPTAGAVPRLPAPARADGQPPRRRAGALLRAVRHRGRACARASPRPRRRCSSCPTAGSRWRRRCRRSAPICAATRLAEAWEAYRNAWRSDTVLASARRAVVRPDAPCARQHLAVDVRRQRVT